MLPSGLKLARAQLDATRKPSHSSVLTGRYVRTSMMRSTLSRPHERSWNSSRGENSTDVRAASCVRAEACARSPARRSQKRSAPSWWPDTAVPPSDAAATALTDELQRSTCRLRAAERASSHTRMVRSELHVSARSADCPAPMKRAPCTLLACPESCCLRRPVRRSHIRTVLSFPPASTSSAEQSAHRSAWPPPWSSSCLRITAASHTLRTASAPTVTSRRPSASNTTSLISVVWHCRYWSRRVGATTSCVDHRTTPPAAGASAASAPPSSPLASPPLASVASTDAPFPRAPNASDHAPRVRLRAPATREFISFISSTDLFFSLMMRASSSPFSFSAAAARRSASDASVLSDSSSSRMSLDCRSRSAAAAARSSSAFSASSRALPATSTSAWASSRDCCSSATRRMSSSRSDASCASLR
mmetsp:Transcript_14851/g.50221  ORF Transcript_14851/g.50221 Transcript_14851/m.50221 type:complete len:419 (-) Transcript_14851:142-1398(-)